MDKDAKIAKLTVWFDNDQVYGLQAAYRAPDGAEIAGKEHLAVENRDQLESRVFEIAADDRIAVITGKYKDFIGYLKVTTVKGNTQEFGYENGTNSVQPFIFDLEPAEFPSHVFGALDAKGNTKI